MWEAVPLDTYPPDIDPGPLMPDPIDAGHGSISDILSRLDEPGGFVPDLDRDGDRVPDTSCLDWRDGIALATDVDRDGRVDTVTTIDRTGEWQIYQRSDQVEAPPEQTWEIGRSGRIE